MHPTRQLPLSVIAESSAPRAPRPFTAPSIPLTSAVVHDAPRQKTARDLLRALEEDLAVDRSLSMKGPIERGVRKIVRTVPPDTAVRRPTAHRRY